MGRILHCFLLFMAQSSAQQREYWTKAVVEWTAACLALEQFAALLPQEGIVSADDETLVSYLRRYEQAVADCAVWLTQHPREAVVDWLREQGVADGHIDVYVEQVLTFFKQTPDEQANAVVHALAKRWADGERDEKWHADMEQYYRQMCLADHPFDTCKAEVLAVAEQIDEVLAAAAAREMLHHELPLRLNDNDRIFIEAAREWMYLQYRHNHVHRFADKRLRAIRDEITRRQQGESAAGQFAARQPLRGMTACRGQAQGCVHVVHTEADMDRMPQGAVLVIAAARPEYTPAFRRAVAIVCDSGGVTSHAAIIAREYKIPCVVATRMATKQLQNGQAVRVNADAGLVEIV